MKLCEVVEPDAGGLGPRHPEDYSPLVFWTISSATLRGTSA